MQGKKDKTKGNDQAFDSVNEDDAPSVEKSRLKRKIGIGIATGIAVVAAGVGITLLANGKLDFRAALHTSAVKGTEAIADGAAEAIAQAPNLLAEEPIAVESRHASQDAISYANAIGVNLAEGQTIVRPQTRLYCRVA